MPKAKAETKKPVTKKTRKKPGRPKGSKNVKKAGRPVATKTKKKAGRPKGKKPGRKPGRPNMSDRKAKTTNSMNLPVDNVADINYWSEFVVFLNNNAGKTFTVQTDGVKWSIHV